jgi:hypothetical protein
MRGYLMARRTPSIWRRISGLLPEITLAIAVAVTLATALWIAWRYGWL